MNWAFRAFTAVVSTVVEAREELRIHRGRVLLSLVGVAVAVLALTTVVAAGAVTEQVSREANDRSSGRPATLSVYVPTPYDPRTGQPTGDDSSASADAAWAAAMERYGIEFHSRVTSQPLRVQFPDGAVDAYARGVDADFGEMHRVALIDGAWFRDDDGERLAPALVVNEAFWDRLGRPPIATNPTIEIVSGRSVTGVVIGVTPRQSEFDTPEAMVLVDTLPALAAPTASGSVPYPTETQYEAWVPESQAEALTAALQVDLRGAIGDGADVQVNRTDWGAWPYDPFLALKLLVGGVAGVILLLGALGLVNIALVTVRARIREIGIRRSFGATSGRVFFAVLMESVVATFLAGAVGVGISIALVRSPLLQLAFGSALDDAPAFPIDAAIIGLAAATAVGAIAGLLPALAAVRVRVIDAIRF